MRIAVLLFLAISVSAHAQFGIGLSPGSMCNGPYGPARQGVNGQDELSNLAGQLAARNNRIDQLKAKEDHLDDYLDRARHDIAQVITNEGFAAIKEHRQRNNSYGSYSQTCGGGGGHANATASAGSQTTDVELFTQTGGGRAVDTTQTQVPPPDVYCVKNPANGQRENIWEKFVEDDGTVSDKLCDFRIAGVTRPANASQRDSCHDGMHEYYERMAEKEKIHDEIARLDKEARAYERRLERIRDEITEGTYCPWCAAQRRGYANQGVGNSMFEGVGLMLRLSLGNQQRPPMYGPQPMYGPRPQFGSPIAPFGGPGFPMRPYSAQMPGYYGMMPGPQPGMGQYGSIPGGMGPGAFGCQGANPAAFGSQFGSPGVQPIFGGQSPFNNPYANPAMMPMFNQGAGPGWGFPQYANGMPGFQDPFGTGLDPFGNPYGQGPFGSPFAQSNPFGMNPYGQNPFGQNMFGQNPFNPYGNQFGMNPWGGGFNPYDPYGSNPYMNQYGGYNPYGGFSPFGPGNPYQGGFNPYGAPGMMPYMGMNPYGNSYPYGSPMGPGYGMAGLPPGGIPNYGYQNPYGDPLGSPTGAFLGQVNMLSNRMQYIQNGGYYGGGYAPPVMPYLNSPQPIYNTPGTIMNPGPMRGNAPAVLPYNH